MSEINEQKRFTENITDVSDRHRWIRPLDSTPPDGGFI